MTTQQHSKAAQLTDTKLAALIYEPDQLVIENVTKRVALIVRYDERINRYVIRFISCHRFEYRSADQLTPADVQDFRNNLHELPRLLNAPARKATLRWLTAYMVVMGSVLLYFIFAYVSGAG